MAVGDDVTEDYVTSLGLSSRETKQSGDMLSPEVAWADSCLIKDPGSDNSWESLKDALLETLHSQTDSSDFEKHDSPEGADLEMIGLSEEAGIPQNWDIVVDNNASTSEGAEKTDNDHINDNNVTFWFHDSPEGADIGMIGLIEEAGIPQNWDKAVDNNASTSEGAEKTDNDHVNDNNDTFWSKINMENVFRPTYNESLRDLGASDTDSDSGFPALVMDQSLKDIFKIWDLDTPDEEDELIKQLNKALTESTLEPSPSVSDDSTVSKDSKEVDDLISGLADLSLIEDSV